MNISKVCFSRAGYLILLVLASCTPATAQGGSGLGGSVNDHAGVNGEEWVRVPVQNR